jgi:Mrp family chromosome partitioning ATPase
VSTYSTAPGPAEVTDTVLPEDGVQGHRNLSVAEMQQALRQLQARRPPYSSQRGVGLHRNPDESPRTAVQTESRPARHSRELTSGGSFDTRCDVQPKRSLRWGDTSANRPEARGDTGVRASRIAVVAAHAGAGASTVALAISDAAAEDGTPVHLIEHASPWRSGLVAAASSELGAHPGGSWRRGRRGNVTLDRRATVSTPNAWPGPPTDDRPGVTVLDLGLLDADGNLPLTDCTTTVVVCRPSVPGVRLAEQLLAQFAEEPVLVAALGPGRWPGEVTASLGPRLRALRDVGRVVAIPMDRRLAVTGLTSGSLPKPVLAAGRNVLQLLALPGEETGRAASSHPSATRGAPRR